MYWCRFPGFGSGLVHALSSYTRLGQQACAEQFLASLTEFEHGIIREARVPVPVGRNAHSSWAAEQIVIMMMSSSRTGKTEGPQRIGFQGDIRRRDGEA
jgi:hypothetical protein